MPIHSRRFVSRRWFLLAGSSLPLLSACSTTPLSHTGVSNQKLVDGQRALHDIEQGSGGRIGVAAINLANGSMLFNRKDERFAMCSTFKWLLGAVVLQKTEQGQEQLDRVITWTADDLVFYSPVTKPLVENSANGIATLTIEELCHATMSTSDNTAANLLLGTMGGPAGLTNAVRSMGDTVTRLDRVEPELNENAPDDPRDTSTPRAMLTLMQTVLFADLLTSDSKDILKGWMIANITGKTRLRAGLPANWTAGDRTGTSSNNANNNLAFAEAPSDDRNTNGPLLIVSFTNAPNPTKAEANAVHANIARVISSTLL